MDDPMPFVNLFPDIYPKRRAVPYLEEGSIGVLIKSVILHRNEEALLCRGLVLHARDGDRIYDTVCFKVVDITPVVGYDLDLVRDQGDAEESWSQVSQVWSRHFVQEPVDIGVLHDDIKRKVNARVFPIRSIALARRYMENVKGALTFGDFCADTGYYVARDGNMPALCCDVMFGRMYFVPEEKANGTLSPCELVYDHERSEAEARLFDTTHAPHFYRAACLDIETVVDESFRDLSLRCDYFAHRFPYCTERASREVRTRRLMKILSEGQKDLCKQSGRVSIPALAGDMPGQEQEITCVSLVIVNSHLPKPGPGRHRKELIVVYNKRKVYDELHPEVDHELATGSGVKSACRIAFYPCSGELALLEKTVALLHRHGVELLYVYNAEFNMRVMEQRVHFYAESNYAKGADPATRKRCSALLGAWRGLFVTRSLSEDLPPFFQFESVRYLEMYRDMLTSVGSVLSRGKLTEWKLRLAAMAGTRWIKFACTSMKLNDVAPFVIAKDRELRGKPPKDPRKLRKLADVAYSKMDEMIHRGGKSLFAVLLYNLVDSNFKRAGSRVPEFLACVHWTLVEDALKRMYVIERGNVPVRAIRDPEGGFTEEGYPVYVVRTPGSETLSDVTRPFVKDRRVKLEYENSSSAYCHVAKKSYVSLTYGLDNKGDLSSLSVKIRGLSAVKSMRSPCDSAVTETFISCVMRGDCVKLEPRAVSCFSTRPWHRLAAGDVILYPERELTVDVRGQWLQLDQSASILAPHRVQRVVELQLDKGFSAVSVTLARPCGRQASETEGSRPEDLTVVCTRTVCIA
ncbi:hypothetical protein Q5P01_019989 [Channa striata]|uniref:Uncharacterized protein n=1 Tax=Channa striata TaxID=64152 RepID=A0AA88S8G5_CHASR|nr:hypothetical protein Q5P01_019989 [Channa striata]